MGSYCSARILTPLCPGVEATCIGHKATQNRRPEAALQSHSSSVSLNIHISAIAELVNSGTNIHGTPSPASSVFDPLPQIEAKQSRDRRHKDRVGRANVPGPAELQSKVREAAQAVLDEVIKPAW
jgi:hypothetical protein